MNQPIEKSYDEIEKADVLRMASAIVSDTQTQIVIIYSRPESGKTVVREYNYSFDGWDYKKTTHGYYKSSSEFKTMSDDPLTLDEMIKDILTFLEGDLEDGESLKVFLERF